MRLPIEGSLLSHDFLRHGLTGACGSAAPLMQPRAFATDRSRAAATLGPAAGASLVFQTAAAPLARWLGWDLPAADPTRTAAGLWCVMPGPGGHAIGMLTVPWARDPGTVTREVITLALEHSVRFAFATNGRELRLVDATRSSVRGALQFDLDGCQIDGAALTALYLLAGPHKCQTSQSGTRSLLEHAIEASDRAGVQVCQSLRHGVREALASIRTAIEQAAAHSPRCRDRMPGDDEALTAVYRMLFLLFAEARRLVPIWHPVYRDGYTLASLRSRLESRASTRGSWAALQAIARLAHTGCEIADLRVAPFNGRLFAPAHAPLLDHLQLDDRSVSAALASLVFVDGGKNGRRRVAYEDLGVEQLGSIYEHLLDDDPRGGPSGTVSRRKVTASFYTPAPLTDYLVRVTLDPLVRGKTVDEILSLRVVDPAMGSGAFLVAACRFLGQACERAHLAAGGECDDELRATWRRRAAQRCLFGVDANPMAVQLAQLSLWLATLAAGRPLSFLDHHLLCGDSLIGATPDDVIRRRPGRTERQRSGVSPLEAFFDAIDEIGHVVPMRLTIEGADDDTATTVRQKERSLAACKTLAGAVHWKAACDLWCTAWLPEAFDLRALYPALLDHALGRTPALAGATIASAVKRVHHLAATHRCFHWPLEFPEVFLDATGGSLPNAGFDAVIGNPPWEMLRADHGRLAAAAVIRFSREAGIYRAQSRGHANQYQLFVERALTLLRPGGRLGMLVPAGFLTDHGAADLRTELLQRHGLESLLVFDNRNAIFPIHRGVRFAAVTAVAKRPSSYVACRFGVDTTDRLHTVALESRHDFPIVLTSAAIERLSGTQMAIPDLRDRRDLQIVEALSAAHPALASDRGWRARFGRELNATDDKHCWQSSALSCEGGASGVRSDMLPVVEGKHLDPFIVRLDRVTRWASIAAVRKRLRKAAFLRARLAYREVAAATNKLTLIAAILPARTISVHTVFCLRTPLAADEQDVLCALLNSFVANYLVRHWVTTHVTASIVERLPVPRAIRGTPQFDELARDAARLRDGEADDDVVAGVQARAARAYGVTVDDFAYILDSFPLVPAGTRQAALRALTT